MKVFRNFIASNAVKDSSSVSIAELKNKFSNAVIVGSGPTSFEYSDLEKFNSNPVLFMNQTHQISHFCISPFKFFITHHIGKYSAVAPTTLWIKRMYLSQHSYSGVIETSIRPKNKFLRIDCQSDDSVVNGDFFKAHPWLLDKNEIIKRKRFLALFGTITTAIHFSWFCGAKKITFIGCNPYTGSSDHDPRFGGKMVYQPKLIHENTIRLPQFLDIEVEHL